MAYPGVNLGNCICVLRHYVSGKTGIICIACHPVAFGGLMLGAVFMATDYVTSPMSHKGMLIYGVCIGC